MARTNVEIPDDLLGWLRGEASKRGLRGFSSIVTEALERLRGGPAEREALVRKALAARLPESEGEALAQHVRDVRKNWRRRSE
jgi:hypothetical protein